jgi:magnesium-protoporphyrin O-methyltransferase
MQQAGSYLRRRDEVAVYFDRTALDAWQRFATNEPLGRIRSTVRAGRDRMRATLLSLLPADLSGWRVLDAGCGAGAMSVELARRGADVLGIDLSPGIISYATAHLPRIEGGGRIRLASGDMLSPEHGEFDAVVAMDSLIHYRPHDAVEALAALAARTSRKIVFTFPPRTLGLSAMHAVGRLFPRGDRAPSIEPVSHATLSRLISGHDALKEWRAGETHRIAAGFYISQAMEVNRR